MMLEPVWTFGGVVIAAMISALALILVARINLVGKKVDTTITQTEPISNGYTAKTSELLEEMRQSLRRVHQRLDSQNSHTARRDDHLDGVLMKFDDRLTYIEEKLP